MNPFKLLSRSTNVTRSERRERLDRPSDTPSSQFEPRPSQIQPSNTKKRKRATSTQSQPNFIADFKNDLSNSLARPLTDSHEATTYVGPEKEKEKKLDENERRRILKEHRIKVTELSLAHNHDNAEQTSKLQRKTRKKPNDSGPLPSQETKQKVELFPEPMTSFEQLQSRYCIPKRLFENVLQMGFEQPTEVQMGSLPLLLHRKPAASNGEDKKRPMIRSRAIDLLTVAPTGSGKTLAYLIPLLADMIWTRGNIDSSEDDELFKGPKAIIVAPTKELARQIVNETRKLIKNTGLRVSMIKKGMKIQDSGDKQKEEIHADDERSSPSAEQPPVKSHILVATPLALTHAMPREEANLPSVYRLVLDEADVLLDPLFRDQTIKIWSSCTNESLRVGLWSATMGSSIENLAIKTISERKKATARKSYPGQQPSIIRLVVGLKDSSIPNIEHRLVYAGNENGKLMGLRQLILSPGQDGPIRPPFLVFMQTIPRAIALHSELMYDISVEAGGSSRIAVLHADLSDTARHEVMSRFRNGAIWVLITTDLLARGVDFRGINGVVNYDFPGSSAAYVHRVGRTGRAGRQGGVAVTLYADEDIPFLKNVVNVVSVSERQGGKVTSGISHGPEDRQWLLESLPKVAKKAKQELKRKGVESRRTKKSGGEKTPNKTKISTKSGFERRFENKKRGAILGSKQRKLNSNNHEEEQFEGFD